MGFAILVGLAAVNRDGAAGLSLIGYARAPHDPGAFASRLGFRGGTWGDFVSLILPTIASC